MLSQVYNETDNLPQVSGSFMEMSLMKRLQIIQTYSIANSCNA